MKMCSNPACHLCGGERLEMNFCIQVHCDKCSTSTEFDIRKMVEHGWDAPVFTRLSDGVRRQGQLCPRHARWWTLRYWARRFQWRLGKTTHRLSPGYGHCHRCLTSWDYVDGHVTTYQSGGGCFVLCEKCWRGLTPEERLPFYRQLFDEWERNGTDVEWWEIEFAVLFEEDALGLLGERK
jgi:hypothetical protein